MTDKQKSTFRVPKDLHTALKIRAVETGSTVSALVAKAVDEYLKRAGVYRRHQHGN